MTLKSLFAGAVLAALTAAGAHAAAPIVVTDTVSGGPGNYTYDFTVTNNIGGANAIYFFTVRLSQTNITGSPSGWGYASWDNPWSNAPYGGSSTVYNNPWCCTFGGLASGQTLGGFKVTDSGSTINTGIQWSAYASGGSDANADGHFHGNGNPGFEGLVGNAVPEPATWALMLVGVGGLGASLRSRRKAGLAA